MVARRTFLGVQRFCRPGFYDAAESISVEMWGDTITLYHGYSKDGISFNSDEAKELIESLKDAIFEIENSEVK